MKPAPASSATAEISITPSSPDTEESNEPLKTEYSPATAAIMPCSPIKGYELNGLSALINNPFTPPPPGRDDPHQGVDFAITQYNIAVAGHPVQSIFSGTIVAVLSDRFPYGNAVLVETPLEDIAFPQDLLYYSAGTPVAGWTPHPSLTCPIITPEPQWDRPVKSLYHLYAHLEKAPEFKSGAPVGCGDRIATLTEATGTGQTVRGRDLAAESMFEYGSRVGFWRLMRLFRERGLPLSVFGCALALERNPDAAKAITEAGHDVCCHGWRWIRQFELTEDEERRHIQQAIESMIRTVGERPLGWYCRYGPSIHTRRLLVEEGGFLYDSDAYNDEIPYWVRVAGKPHLVVPYSLSTNDLKFGVGGFFTGDDFFAFLKDGFDVLYREGTTQPRMMSVGLHMRLVGHPSRAAGLERFLDYAMKHVDVWICRRIDIAKHWIQHHPFSG